MQSNCVHTRIIQHPFATHIQGARLDAFYDTEQDLFLDVQGLEILSSEVFEQEERLWERVRGRYIPMRLKFSKVTRLYYDEFFTSLENYPKEDASRTIVHFLSWRQPEERDIHYRLGLQGPVYGSLHFFARPATCERLEKSAQAITFERDWSPAPPMPERLVPRPKHLYKQFGGDPVTIKVNGKLQNRKLWIGELGIQPKHRPQVDAVLNLGEETSRWVRTSRLHPNDRAINRGEGTQGMTVAEICEEANWVIERLEQNQRVLVHCVAGMNLSVTICCATLILLEGLGACEALDRVREHHPWARPDSRHWLALRWLEVNHR